MAGTGEDMHVEIHIRRIDTDEFAVSVDIGSDVLPNGEANTLFNETYTIPVQSEAHLQCFLDARMEGEVVPIVA